MRIATFLKSLAIAAFALVLTCSLEADGHKDKKKKDDRPFISVVQKDGKKASRKCFRDEDGNGFCDRGSEQKGKCPNNCRRADFAKKEKDGDRSREGDRPEAKRNGDRPDLKREGDRPGEKKKNGGDKPKASPSPEDDGGWSLLPCSGCPLAGACNGKCVSGLI